MAAKIKYHVEPIKTQLFDDTVDNWLSYGVTEVEGRFVSVHRHDKGLVITLDNGREVVWIVAESVADKIAEWANFRRWIRLNMCVG